ncbi:MAG: DinB family protein [Acidimicrobiia bacterium]
MTNTLTRERQDLLETLGKHRGFLRQTLDGLDDEQVRATPTVSALSLGAIVKHVTAVERMWREFVHVGAEAFADATPEKYAEEWALPADATAASLLAAYAAEAAVTDEVVATVDDLDAAHPLPDAPWFPPGATWSNRRVLLHIIAETSQHAGHADIIREAIDGAKTMG